jgi:hypothetical protein
MILRFLSFWRKTRKEDFSLSLEGAIPPFEGLIVSPAFESPPNWPKVSNKQWASQWEANMPRHMAYLD